MGGIKAANLTGVIFQIDGTIAFSDDIDNWPTYANGQVNYFSNLNNANLVNFQIFFNVFY